MQFSDYQPALMLCLGLVMMPACSQTQQQNTRHASTETQSPVSDTNNESNSGDQTETPSQATTEQTSLLDTMTKILPVFSTTLKSMLAESVPDIAQRQLYNEAIDFSNARTIDFLKGATPEAVTNQTVTYMTDRKTAFGLTDADIAQTKTSLRQSLDSLASKRDAGTLNNLQPSDLITLVTAGLPPSLLTKLGSQFNPTNLGVLLNNVKQ